MAAVPTLSDGPSWGQCAPYGGAGWIELSGGEILVFGQRSAFPALPEAACEILTGTTLRRLLKAGADQPWEREQVRRIWAQVNPSAQQSLTLDAMADSLTGWDMYSNGIGRLRAYRFRPLSFGSASALGTEGKASIAQEFGTALPGVGGSDVGAMTYGQRVVAAMPHALDAALPELKDELSKLLQPEALAVMVAAIALLAGIAMTGVGTAVLVVVFWALVGWVAFDLARALWQFLEAIGKAGNPDDLKEAGRLFAEFGAKAGIELAMIGLFGIAGKFAKSAGGAAKARRAAQASDDVPVSVDDVVTIKRAASFRQTLIDELSAQGIKHTPDNIIEIRKLSDGRIIFLESGNEAAGFSHILKHSDEFNNKGISDDTIPDFIMENLVEGKIVGYQGRNQGRPIYEVIYEGITYRTAITVGDNGYVVGANPVSLP